MNKQDLLDVELMISRIKEDVNRYNQNSDYITPLFLDTETTGIGDDAKIVEITVADLKGEVIIDTLINPEIKIPKSAYQIHKISDDMVKSSPTFPEIEKLLNELISDRKVYIYNADYDVRLIQQSASKDYKKPNGTNYIDLMVPFSRIYGEYNEYHQNYKWQKLSTACRYYNIDTSNFEQHRSKGDVLATIEIFKKMEVDLE